MTGSDNNSPNKSGSGEKQGRKLNVLNSVSEKVARGRNEKLEEDLLSTYTALEHNKGRKKQLLSQEQLKLRRLMSVKLCPVSVVNRARLELHSQGRG
ncbi:hypothetical protein ACHWQZ_G014684 [Mnemiopsis leidyi]